MNKNREASSEPTQNSPPSQTTLNYNARSDLWFYPGEELAEGELRVSLMGTGWGNVIGPAQKGPSVFIELGNKAQDSFVFDVGPGCILNYNAMDIPMSRMNHIFLSHLHMDHCSDLSFIYAFGPNLGDRYTPLNIYGPSGPTWPPNDDDDHQAQTTTLGTRNLVEGMKQFTQWHTTSFSTMSEGAGPSYDAEVHEFDYRLCNGKVFELDTPEHGHICITSFPALHIIDGAVSYRLEWTPAGQDQAIVVIYSGDTLPNEFMLEYGKGADLMIHETAPSVTAVMNGANVSSDDANNIVSNSHTPAYDLGYIFKHTEPKLGITTHTPVDQQSVDAMITEVRRHWKGPYQIGADFMVFNVSNQSGQEKTTITTRMGAPIERPWPVRITEAKTGAPLAGDLKYLRKALSQNANPGVEGIIFNQEIELDKGDKK